MDQPSPSLPPGPERSLAAKFGSALRGVGLAIRRERNYRVHLAAASAVVVAACVVRATPFEWSILGLCVALVLVAETLNTAIEHLAKAVADRPNEYVGRALDVAAGAVLLAAVAAGIVGGLVLTYRLGAYLGWWSG